MRIKLIFIIIFLNTFLNVFSRGNDNLENRFSNFRLHRFGGCSNYVFGSIYMLNLFIDYSDLNSIFQNEFGGSFKSNSLNFGIDASMCDNNIYKKVRFGVSLFDEFKSRPDTLYGLNSYHFILNFGTDLIDKKFLDLLPSIGIGIGYNEISSKKSGEKNDFELWNFAGLFDFKLELKVNTVYNNKNRGFNGIGISFETGYLLDISNPDWKINKDFEIQRNPKTKMSGLYYGISIIGVFDPGNR